MVKLVKKAKNKIKYSSDSEYDLVVIGGGPGGMAAAVKAAELGLERVLLIERDLFLGGILPQCIHGGFGIKIFNSELTGPEYCQFFIEKVRNVSIKVMLDTMAVALDLKGEKKSIVVSNRNFGIKRITAKAIILSLGCRERTRGQILIPGSRPAGVLTAGLVQRMVNIEGYLPGKNIVILGSGDIGLIMARRLILEGCNVKGVFELMPFSTGLLRNISQCLEDFDIPLYLGHTVTKIYGNKRIEAVDITMVDKNLKLLKTKTKNIKCDTLLLSVGLIPENELSKTAQIEIDQKTGGPVVNEYLHTSQNGVFACGNSLFVNDIVDNVTEDGYLAAQSAVSFLNGRLMTGKLMRCEKLINISAGENIAYIIPQKVSGKSDVNFRIRASVPLRNAFIEFSNIGLKKKVRFVNPGELIFAKITKDDFGKFPGYNTKTAQDSIKVSIKKEVQDR
jgi:NADPH-dependent 2,4-dienoyl-CoA reductase/sulfur reductase-like enzyme